MHPCRVSSSVQVSGASRTEKEDCCCVLLLLLPLQIVTLRYRGEGMVSPDLFILGIVSYCLGMSLLTEKMGLSHEVRL